MEILGMLAFVLVLGSLGLPGKLKKLNNRLLKLEKSTIKREGIDMSEILKGLVGEHCSVKETNGTIKVGTVLAVDDEWIKLSIVQKNTESIVIKRIDQIEEVTIVSK